MEALRLTRTQAAVVAVELEAWARSDYVRPELKWKLRERANQIRQQADRDGVE